MSSECMHMVAEWVCTGAQVCRMVLECSRSDGSTVQQGWWVCSRGGWGRVGSVKMDKS